MRKSSFEVAEVIRTRDTERKLKSITNEVLRTLHRVIYSSINFIMATEVAL